MASPRAPAIIEVEFEMPNEDDEIAIIAPQHKPPVLRDRNGHPKIVCPGCGALREKAKATIFRCGACGHAPEATPAVLRKRWATLIGPMRERLRADLAGQP